MPFVINLVLSLRLILQYSYAGGKTSETEIEEASDISDTETIESATTSPEDSSNLTSSTSSNEAITTPTILMSTSKLSLKGQGIW